MNKRKNPRKIIITAAAVTAVAAAAFIFLLAGHGRLVLLNADTGEKYASYPLDPGHGFSITFIHSVNQYPLTDFYEIKEGGIWCEKTIYSNFGAGVQTELNEGETLSYGEDGSIIVSGINKRLDNLIYIVGTVSDHTLVIDGGEEISLRGLCGRNAKVRFKWEPYLLLP